MTTEIPPLPDMTEDEILDRAAQLLGGDLKDMDYAAIVRVLTVANYMVDISIRELGGKKPSRRVGGFRRRAGDPGCTARKHDLRDDTERQSGVRRPYLLRISNRCQRIR